MKKYNDIKKELNKKNFYKNYESNFNRFTEIQLSRVWRHSKNGFFAISAFKPLRGLEGQELKNRINENIKNHKNLKNDVRNRGLGFYEIDGTYTYKDTGETENELSLFVPYDAIHTREEFKNIAIWLMKRYNQESVLYVDENGVGYFLEYNGGMEKMGSGLSLNKIGDYYSKIRKGSYKGTTFVFEGYRQPKDYTEILELKYNGYKWSI